MLTISKKSKIIIALTLCALLAIVGLLAFTEICTLQAVTLNGDAFSNWEKKSSLIDNKSILRQPLKEFVATTLADEQTLKVDYNYSWPHTLNVAVNSISPVCMLLDKISGNLLGVDNQGRVIPLKTELVDWERPIITGIAVNKLYIVASDVRVRPVLNALEKIRNEKINFYRLIEQIDFNSPSHIEVSISGQDHTIWLRAECFYNDISRYIDFAARYNLELNEIKTIDLCQDGQIVTKRGKI